MAAYKGHRTNPDKFEKSQIKIILMVLPMVLLCGLPIVFIIFHAFKPMEELFAFPPKFITTHPTLDNFRKLIKASRSAGIPLSKYVFNSIFITVVVVLGSLIFSTMAAYALSKLKFKGRTTMMQINQIALMFVSCAVMIPRYLIVNKLGMIDTYWAIILPAFAAPIGLFLMKQFMEGLPTALIEAAHLDGAGEFRIFWSIVMPNVKPAWLTIIIFSVQNLWNTNAATVIYTEKNKTLVYALQQIQAGGIARTGQAAAVTVIVMLVPILIFILSQSRILETMASSGLKD